LPPGSSVRWEARLANRKDAVKRPASPPPSPLKPVLDPTRADRLIEASASVTGASAPRAILNGSYRGKAVNLGDIRTDGQQRLIVLGGYGVSETLSIPPAPIGGSFYNNPDWYDDVSDGPVSAVISLPGEPPTEAKPAWVVVGPPDFAPVSLSVVTLYDVIRQVAIEQGWATPPGKPFFDTDIRPMIRRAADLRFVNGSSVWKAISLDWARLGSTAPADKPLRTETAGLVRDVETVLQSFELRTWQLDALTDWVNGNFNAGAAPDRGACDRLTRAALDGTVGQGFFPGIEAGINLTDPSIFETEPFEYRFRAGAVNSGDMTAHMALPWQADFLKCGSGWWPSQRPNHAPQAAGPERPWLRPTMTHQDLVDDVMKLGVISEGPGGQVTEQGRDPVIG